MRIFEKPCFDQYLETIAQKKKTASTSDEAV
jgi:hypothetical protein